MKKLITVLTAVAMIACMAATLTGCSKKSSGKKSSANELVIFEPGVTQLPFGEIVKVGKQKFLKVTVDGYGTAIEIPAVDCTGKNTYEAVCFAENANENFNLTLGLKDDGYADISSPAMYGLVTEPQTEMAGNAEKQPWNSLSESRVCSIIQPMVQDSTDGYREQYGVVVYIGKIIAK